MSVWLIRMFCSQTTVPLLRRTRFHKPKAAAEKALELDRNLAEVHAALAILFEYGFDSPRAISEYERAIELSPNYANAHHWFGDGPLMALAMADRSIAEGKRSVELDPLSLINNADLGWNYINARRYDEAIAQLRKTIEIDSHFYLAHYYLGEGLQLKGKLAEAIAEYQTAVELNDDPLALAFLGQAYARAGQKARGAGDSRAPDRRIKISLRFRIQPCASAFGFGRQGGGD